MFSHWVYSDSIQKQRYKNGGGGISFFTKSKAHSSPSQYKDNNTAINNNKTLYCKTQNMFKPSSAQYWRWCVHSDVAEGKATLCASSVKEKQDFSGSWNNEQCIKTADVWEGCESARDTQLNYCFLIIQVNWEDLDETKRYTASPYTLSSL